MASRADSSGRSWPCAALARCAAWTAAVAASAVVGGCDGAVDGPRGPCDEVYTVLSLLRIDRVAAATPIVAGSQLHVRGESFVVDETCAMPRVVLRGTLDGERREVPLEVEVGSLNEMTATVGLDQATALGGSGAFEGELEVRYDALDGSLPFVASLPLSFTLAPWLEPVVEGPPQGPVFLNDELLVEGMGILAEGEGVTELVAQGTCTDEETGEVRRVSGLHMAVVPIEPDERGQGTFQWSPWLCGPAPGFFEGSAVPRNAHLSGSVVEGPEIPLVFNQQETTMISIAPGTVSLGQIVDVVGRGFIGGHDGTTTVRLVGAFDHVLEGISEQVDMELVGRWLDGELIQYPIVVSSVGGVLHATDFGALRGTFTGRAVPITTMQGSRRAGLGAEVTLTLGPVRQIVWVRFTDGFSDSLELFGLGAVEREVVRRILERMEEIYCPLDEPDRCVNVELRTERPDDYYEGGYSILDIGGHDPNGIGLLGYDNNAGKDVGNLRLHDHIGGANALGGVDGISYGGVFIESLLYWSDHPPFEDRPVAAPPPEPRFDEIFDPLREQEVVADEWPDGTTPERHDQIELAIHALSSMVADTAAHELGHSLGLALPYGSPAQFHNPIPADGCLMDAGADRPFAERARIDGNEGAHFCEDNLAYLLAVLPRE